MKARRPITRRSKESDSTSNQNRTTQTQTSSNDGEDGTKSENKTVFQLSIPGALQCIYHEFAKREVDSSKLVADKCELEAKVAFLKGQLKGQGRVVHDLVCRVKMLEYSLKEERVKFHKLKYGTEPQQSPVKPPEPNTGLSEPVEDQDFLAPKDWRQGRQLIRQYLSEIGYTEAVVNVNSYQVNSLLQLYDNPANRISEMGPVLTTPIPRPPGSPKTREGSSSDHKLIHRLSITNNKLGDVDAELTAKFEFRSLDEDADDECEENEDGGDRVGFNELKVSRDGDSQWIKEWQMEHSEDVSGDLADLDLNTVADHSDYMSWKIKYMLRGHYDSVRSLAFHPEEPMLATASEDHTVNLWNLDQLSSSKVCDDLKPSHTYRGHSCQVMCVAISPTGKCAFSGGVDGSLLCWDLPVNKQAASLEQTMRLEGHTDVVWGLSHQLFSDRTTLLSCSSDGSVKLWAPEETPTSLSTFRSQEGDCPTSVDFVRAEFNHMITSYDNGECILYDLEYEKPLVWLEIPKDHGPVIRINRVVCHPVLPLTVTGGEDGCIRFFNNTTGRLVQTIVAHQESIMSVAIDRYGMYMLTGSHDRTVCMWDMRAMNRIQQIYTHGKKFQESVFDVAFHRIRPLISSAGADGYVQVFKPA